MLKDITADVRKEITDEAVLNKVNPLLAQIEQLHLSTKDELTAVRDESVKTRTTLRKAEGEIVDLKVKVDTNGDDTELKEAQQKIVDLTTFQKQIFGEKKITLADKVKKYQTHESFETVKGNLGLLTKTEKDAEGKDQIVIDVDSMDDAAVNNSLGKFIEYENIEVFGEKEPEIDPVTKKPVIPKIQTPEDPDKIDRKQQAKDDPKAFAEYRKERAKTQFIK